MASSIIHGREGALYLSTGADTLGSEIGYTNSWSVSMTRDIAEVTPLNTNSKEYVKGLLSGTVSAEGSFRVGDTLGVEVIMNRFARLTDSTTAVTPISDGNLYLHMVMKPIDTAGTTDEIKGASLIAEVLSNGFSLNASGTDISGWSYEGTVDGDLTHYRSSDTSAAGLLPLKVQ